MNIERNDMPQARSASPIYRDYIKRIVDLTIAIPVFAVAAIPMGIIAIAIKVDSKGPVFFKQDRIGKDKKVFLANKILTVIVNKKSPQIKAIYT